MKLNQLERKPLNELQNHIDEMIKTRKSALKCHDIEVNSYYQIKDFIKKCGYTQTVRDALRGYRDKCINKHYVACSTENIVVENYKALKILWDAGYRE